MARHKLHDTTNDNTTKIGLSQTCFQETAVDAHLETYTTRGIRCWKHSYMKGGNHKLLDAKGEEDVFKVALSYRFALDIFLHEGSDGNVAV